MNKINLRLSVMVKVLPFYLFTFSPLTASAQTFTQRIQQQAGGQGTVTITQSADIDKLVNTANLTPAAKPSSPTPSTGGESARTTTPSAPGKTATSSATTATGSEKTNEPVDMSKKVMRNGVKVNGFRVQAFAGGNSRKDRQQAEQVGNNIKAHFADVPVYVHFYTPRWICRVGNYRTYEEAHQMLVALRNLGYSQASIVKGKITVQY